MMMRVLESIRERWGVIGILGLSLMSLPAMASPPNVLFIAVDDLRPELGCYGKSHIKSPNIDSLANTGTVFDRAYCMVPTCGASRASLMTGLRPSRNRFVNYLTWADRDAVGIVTLNTHFKSHGYRTLSLGKVFHQIRDSAEGWSEDPWRPKVRGHYARPENQKLHFENGKKESKPTRGPAVESADVPDNRYGDGMVADMAVSKLQELSIEKAPFFLAVGFYKPHLPFVAPTRYWDMYPEEDIELPANYFPPADAPDGAVHTFGELRSYHEIPNSGILSAEKARELIRGYYACVSYTDAQIGKVLSELSRLGLDENTIVVLWGDHGWNLGEHTMWCKHSTFETSMHAPLIVRAPGYLKGRSTPALTEFIDIYPSLCELAGLPLPVHLEGRSFVPLLKEPDLKWKSAAIGRYRNGDTIRTDQFRYTQYWSRELQKTGRMLYDHSVDSAENVNLSELPEHRATVDAHVNQLLFDMGRPNP
jgi:iduronate 2-sulfatase